jgi:hypothetical protein
VPALIWPWLILLIITVVSATALAVATAASALLDRAAAVLDRIGRRRWLDATLVLLVSMIVCLALATRCEVQRWRFRLDPPAPIVHDEFAYLLAGDTFAHGRLTNPPHPTGLFFETFHVIQWPTYAAKFPIGQGLSLAIGFLAGLPILGVWLTIATASAAVMWMLRAAPLPPPWALGGGLLTPCIPLVTWWGQSYWGGGVAMLGGALLIGAALRVVRRPRVSHGVILGIGLAVLANSRPLEGLIVAIIVLGFVGFTVLRRGLWRTQLRRTALPAMLVMLPVLAFMGYDNARVTGDALTVPYVLHQRQYMVAPLVFFQHPRDEPPEFHHRALADFYARDEMDEYTRQRELKRLPAAVGQKLWTILINFGNPPAVALPLLAAVAAARRRRALRLALLVFVGLPLSHFAITPWFRPQYLAPATPCFLLLVVAGLREMSGRGLICRSLARATIVTILACPFVWATTLRAATHPPAAVARRDLVAQLQHTPGQHLVLVRYGPHHDPTFEWVFNGADIDGSKIVFARSFDPKTDQQLLDYFNGRRVWDLYFDEPELLVRERRPSPSR